MQSAGNIFWGDVVFNSFNNSSRDEENILDQIYGKQICLDLYYDDYYIKSENHFLSSLLIKIRK